MSKKEAGKDKLLDLESFKKQKEEEEESEFSLNEESYSLAMQIDGVDCQINALWISVSFLSQSIVNNCDNKQKEKWQDFQKTLNLAMQKFTEFWEES